MENRLEKKLRFFALYFGQEVHRGNRSKHLDHLSIMRNQKFGHLELKPLSDISDEDSAYIAKLIPTKHNDDTYDLEPFQHTADYLRSKGYLLPFMDLSIEQILEYKWAVIK